MRLIRETNDSSTAVRLGLAVGNDREVIQTAWLSALQRHAYALELWRTVSRQHCVPIRFGNSKTHPVEAR